MSEEGLRPGTTQDFADLGLAAFAEASARMRLSVNPEDSGLVREWLEFYSKWPGRRVIGFTDPGDVAVKLLADSFAVHAIAGVLPPGDAIDLGSGNGWPGLALCAARRVCLLDSRKGACDFMRGFVRSAALDRVDVIEARAEDAVKDPALAGRFSVVTTRAMASPAVALELAAPFLSRGGVAVLWLGPEQESAVDAHPEVRELGVALTQKRRYALPGGMGKRALAAYRKTGTGWPGYPRKIPSIKTKPLL